MPNAKNNQSTPSTLFQNIDKANIDRDKITDDDNT